MECGRYLLTFQRILLLPSPEWCTSKHRRLANSCCTVQCCHISVHLSRATLYSLYDDYKSVIRTEIHILVDWLTHLLRIGEVLVSNVGPETGFPTEIFCGFPQSFQSITLKLGHDRILSHPSKFIIYLSHLRRKIVQVTKRTSLNELQISE
jgi:hypothetical protein